MQERLQKLLAQAGYGSRRACEEFITRRACARQWTGRNFGAKG